MTEDGDSGAAMALGTDPVCVGADLACVRTDPARVVDPDAALAALRARGADRFDPVAFRFVEAIAERTASSADAARPLLEVRLARALVDYGERFERADAESREALADATERFPGAVTALRQHCDNGDFGGLRRLLARLEARGRPGPLSALLDEIGRHAPDAELKSVDRFRATWSRLAVERQLSRAFAQAPENAGPLNSEHLVLRSLGLMRDTSPEYLASFMSWVDALFWLDQAVGDPVPDRKGGSNRVQGKEKGRGGKLSPLKT